MMMDSLYGPLVKQLGLSPEAADKFKDMMADNALKASDKVGSLFGGQSSANPSDLAASAAADQKSAEDEMKAFLGDAGFAQYQDYQQTVADRMQLAAFKQQTAGTDSPLTDQQTDQLLAFMKEEKQNLAANTGQTPPGGAQGQAHPLGMLTDEVGMWIT
jgi:hypothetical protein